MAVAQEPSSLLVKHLSRVQTELPTLTLTLMPWNEFWIHVQGVIASVILPE